MLGCQYLHDRRLYDWNECHIRVGRYGDRANQVVSQFGCKVNSCRTVCSTDDTDGTGFLCIESQSDSREEGKEDAQLCSRSHEQGLRVRDQRTKVGHGSNAQEYQRRQDWFQHIEYGEYTSIRKFIGIGDPLVNNVVQENSCHWQIR